MTDKDKQLAEQVMGTCQKMFPRMSDHEKHDFLKFTEGMAFLADHRVRPAPTTGTAPQQPQT